MRVLENIPKLNREKSAIYILFPVVLLRESSGEGENHGQLDRLLLRFRQGKESRNKSSSTIGQATKRKGE